MVLLQKLRGRSRLTTAIWTHFQIDRTGIKIIYAGDKPINLKGLWIYKMIKIEFFL
jgi:hypothetical protein